MNWDAYFLNICNAVATKSPCLSIQRGAILVRDKSVVATGYNGPARGVPHCGYLRLMSDEILSAELKLHAPINPDELKEYAVQQGNTCPRKIMNFMSGEGLEWCTAAHAEQNTIANAARLGVSTFGTTLYMNCEIPCKTCFNILINAGVVEIVVTMLKAYDSMVNFIINNSSINIRGFEL